jgi:hypothetical protein
MINKNQLFKTAWTLAKNKAFMEGGTSKEWFAYGLTQAWKMAKPAVKKEAPARIQTQTKVVKIKDWFIEKNFDINDLMIYQTAETFETLQETEKAVFVKITGSYGRAFATWIPKSCLAA